MVLVTDRETGMIRRAEWPGVGRDGWSGRRRRLTSGGRTLASLSLVAILVLAAGCHTRVEEEKGGSMFPENASLLDDVTRQNLWFHAKKTRPIWARRLKRDERVTTLEGDELVPAGNYLCRGEAGDIWPQTEERLRAKYVATDESDAAGFTRWEPHPDAQGVLAAQIDRPFQVRAEWGMLSGKAGDYLLKNYEDRDNARPRDVWIVDQQLFEATYERQASR